MFSQTRIALAAAMVLGATFTASAATEHQRVSHARPPATYTGSDAIITNQCLPTDNPCRTQPDGW